MEQNVGSTRLPGGNDSRIRRSALRSCVPDVPAARPPVQGIHLQIDPSGAPYGPPSPWRSGLRK
jgi:hypothetical protein